MSVCEPLQLVWDNAKTRTRYPCACGWVSKARRPEVKGTLGEHIEQMNTHLRQTRGQ